MTDHPDWAEDVAVLLREIGRLRRQIAQMEAAFEQSIAIQGQLKDALDTRIIVEQAKGRLAERYDVGADEAFDAIRGYARTNNQKLVAVAEAVIAGNMDITPRPRASQ